jgi:amino acid transporter
MPFASRYKRILLGQPLPTSAHAEERLNNAEALAILSSDALSSVAYATQEILLVLGLAGAAALQFTLPITGLIVLLMMIVGISYRQTILAYPQGGGSYTVSYENVGKWGGLVAGASLAIDYVLTVAVSVAAGIDAAVSYFPALDGLRVVLCLLAVALLMVANLRGVRASAALLCLPTYLFIGAVMVLIVGGSLLLSHGQLPVVSAGQQTAELSQLQASHHGGLHALGLVLLMKAFSSGCAALTGIEAISNGVMAFKPTEWRNARRVLTVMVVLLATMFGGISLLAHHTGVIYVDGGPTLLFQLGQRVFGKESSLLFLLQLGTLLILLLAANTAYADFPRLSALLARDGFLPRQLASLGDRLVFSNGIVALSVFSGLLLIATKASVAGLIGLYAVGVFLCFTLSQAGMVVHWTKLRDGGWIRNALVNGFGSLVTAVVTGVLLYSKFRSGAWLIVILVPLLLVLFLTIKRHYTQVAKRLWLATDKKLSLPPAPAEGGAPVVVLVGQLHRGSFEAVRYARSIARELVAVHVDLGLGKAEAFKEQWQRQLPDIPLVVLDSPYRSLIDPVLDFVRAFEIEHKKDRDTFCTVVLPVFVTRHRWENILHNQSTISLRSALRAQGTRVVSTVGFYL